VAAFTPALSRTYYRKQYRSDNCLVVAAGNVDHAKLVALAERFLTRLQGRGSADTTLSRPSQARQARAFLTKDTEQAHLMYGTTTVGAGHAGRFALTLFNTIFGGTMSSRLFQEVREKRGLVYAVYSMPVLYRGRGTFCIYAGTRPEKGKTVAALLERELAKIAHKGAKRRELDRARASAKGAMALALESTSKRMLRLSDSLLLGRKVLSAAESFERLDAVTLSDIAECASSLGESPSVLAVVGPYKDSDWSLG
jgi:predicted Zn-dependent peptidase